MNAVGLAAPVMPHALDGGALDWPVFLQMLALALLGGLILNLMPCVLPVLSIKLLSVLKQSGRARGEVRLVVVVDPVAAATPVFRPCLDAGLNLEATCVRGKVRFVMVIDPVAAATAVVRPGFEVGLGRHVYF